MLGGGAAGLPRRHDMAAHTLAFLDPAHFHAALTLRERHPRVADEILVYAQPGPELDDFLALVDAFNRRGERPTAWRPAVRSGPDPLERLVADRRADAVVLAGRNDRKARQMRRLHDAGLHVLADKPWLAGPDGLDDVRHVLSGGPVAMEIMTGRHEITSILARALAGTPEVLGELDAAGPASAVEMASVHYLEKTVNGAPLRRPAWYFDVRVQGDGIADIPTHLVDQAQQIAAAARPAAPRPMALALREARRWTTAVPADLFARVTGAPAFPPELAAAVAGGELIYACNARLSFSVGGVAVATETRWDLSAPAGGGDAHHSVIRGTRAEVRVDQDAATGFRRRLSVVPRAPAADVRAALARAVAAWQADRPGVAIAEIDGGFEIRAPRGADSGHESHFPLVLAEFLDAVDRGRLPGPRAAETLAKYALLASAPR